MGRLSRLAPVRLAALAAGLALVIGAPGVAAASARSDYERVAARVEAMRLDGPRPTPRPQMRRAVADAERVARRHAGSGYADNALWQAATVALAAWRVYRHPADRTLGLQILDTLVRRYPSSSLVPDARALIRKHAAQTSAAPRPQVASAPPVSRPAAAASTTPPPAVSVAPVPPAAHPPAESAGRLATLRGLRRTQIGDVVRLTLDFDGEVTFEQQRLAGPDRVYFDFARTAAIPSLSDTVLQFEGPAVRRVRLGQPRPDVTRLVVDLDGVAAYTVFALYHPYRLTIDLQPALQTPPQRPGVPQTTILREPATPLLRDAPPTPRAPVTTPVPVVLPATLAVPTPPPAPALLAARRVTSAAAPRPAPSPARVSVVLPPLAVDGTPLSPGIARRPVPAAPQLASRVVSTPPALLRARVLRATMTRTAIRPPLGLPRGLDLAAFVALAERPSPARPDRRASAPVVPLPIIPTPPAENGAGGFSIARQLGLGASRIVIDPGHGGKDPGAPGSKTTEAEVVLDVALRLERLLAAEAGIEVVLTRRDDTYVPLEERTAIANRHRADLFLSIHANSSRNRKAAGVETYVLNFATSADAAAVAARENATAAGSMRNLPDIVRAITQNNKRDESRELAGAVQEALVSRLRPHNPPMRDLGVKQAPFVVLIGAGMPSVLAEIAFISHESEGGLLRTEKYRQRIAEALGAAVLRYTRTLKPVGTIASQDE
jgi:N-acetylmuramoyl-L-alanine amidase